jgi:hypothetical protein
MLKASNRRLRGKAAPVTAFRPGNTMSEAAADVLPCTEHGCINTSSTTKGQSWGDSGARQYFRCNPCNAFRKRLSGVLRNVEPELAHSFRSFSAEEKQKFRDANISKFSPDLSLALQTVVEEAPASNQKMV